MTITIIGTGYVGLVSGACFAELGFKVTCVDNNKSKIDNLIKGNIPIYEPGLEKIIKKNKSRLSFTTDVKKAVNSNKIIFIAVGTPTHKDGGADLSYIFDVADKISQHLTSDSVVVIKSTVPVGTNKKFREKIINKRPGLKFHMASNPEFLREGCAVNDFLKPDRIIIGAGSEIAKNSMKRIYQPLIKNKAPVLFTDIETAELTKYAANAFLAAKITFINEIANICENVGANIDDVAKGMGLDPRIGKDYLKPGPGFGGSCFPKDTLALLKTSYDLGVPSKIISSTISSNESRKLFMVLKIMEAMKGKIKEKKIAILGLAFKANTDDIRESSALVIINELLQVGANLKVYDPKAMKEAKKILGNKVLYAKDAYDATKNSDLTVIVTEWNEFGSLDLKKLKTKKVLDLRNLYDINEIKKSKVPYFSLGRKSI